MNFSDKVGPAIDRKLSSTKKLASLNPNAAEFLPFSLRSPSGRTSIAEGATSLSVSGTTGKSVLNRSESSISNHSDEEFKLPDDIIPDFKVIEEGAQGINSIPFSTLALHEGNQTSRISSSKGSGFFSKELHDLSPHGSNGSTFLNNISYSVPSYGEDAISGNFRSATAKPWDKQMMNNNQFMSLVRDGSPYYGNSTQGLLKESALPNNTEMDPLEMNPLEFLASRFPGFASESLVEVYFANGGDLNLAMEMLTQLGHQVDGGLSQNLNSKALSAPNLTAMDFSALSAQDSLNSLPKYGGDDTQLTASSYQPSNKDNLHMLRSSSTIPTRGAIDFATAHRKMPPQDGGIWPFERKGSADASVGSSRSSHVLASSYNGGQGRGIYSDRVPSRSTSQAAPAWLDTGDAVENMYSKIREVAHEQARMRNVYLEQARHAYILGNQALAKELSVKGQLHDMHMKAVQDKAQQSIYHQRNPVGLEMQGSNGGGQERIIDLHGFHVIDAINVLKREIPMLRIAARSSDQRLQVYICVGTGHHSPVSHTTARLPIAVQRYLLEEEGLDYTEPQPGMLRVLVY